MDTKLKKVRVGRIAKVVLFAIMVLSFTGAVHVLMDNKGDLRLAFEKNYYRSTDFANDYAGVLQNLSQLINKYKSTSHILEGRSIPEDYKLGEEYRHYRVFVCCSGQYDPELGEDENYERFLDIYGRWHQLFLDETIRYDIRTFHRIQHELSEQEGLVYYATDGQHVFANTPMAAKEQFQQYRAYFAYEGFRIEVVPEQVKQNARYYWFTSISNEMESDNNKIYMAIDNDHLGRKMGEWHARKQAAEKQMVWLAAFTAGFLLSFAGLAAVAGRTSREDRTIRLLAIDRWYTDVSLIVFMVLVFGSIVMLMLLDERIAYGGWDETLVLYLQDGTALLFALLAFPLVFSIVRHTKNGSLFRHTLIYTAIRKAANGIRHLYESGSIGVRTVLLVVGYPILVVVTFFMFPITLGLAAWFTLRKLKAFTAIRQGVERIRNGDFQHKINVGDKGELAVLAGHINGIADGLGKAVQSELRSERLKTELITNVSHDIRTPLTSIITYVDLLKREQDPAKAREYIEVLEQKSERLKMLTDDLFEAAKASSGNMPVHLEPIDIVSLLKQGLGELNEEVERAGLQFLLKVPEEERLVMADGRLLWRAMENLLSNIFKYALKGSRVYIDMEESDGEIAVVFKNISAEALNMPAEELMERFTRGDAARTGEGSGLGLGIARNLLELQRGRLDIEIDGDLFKAKVRLPKVGP